MRNRKVIRILLSLPPDEWTAFRAYLESPYLNSNGRILRLFHLIHQYILSGDPAQPDPEASDFWEQGLSSGPFHANGFDKLCAELLAALNDFLVLQQFKSASHRQAPLLMEAYLDHHLGEWIPALDKLLAGRYAEDFKRDPEGMMHEMKFLRARSVHLLRQPRAPRGESLLDLDAALTRAFLAQKLEIAAGLSTVNRILNTDHQLPEEQMMLDLVEQHYDTLPPFIQVQYLGYLTAARRENSHYHAFRKALEQHRKRLPPDDAEHLFRIALNHCFYRLNEGDLDFLAETDQLLVQFLEEGWLLFKGKLPPEHYKNIISVRLREGHLEWVEAFIETWGPQLTNDHAGAAQIYNQGVLDYYKGAYSEAMRAMEEVLRDFKADVYYGLDARLIQIKCLFSRNSPDDADDLETRLNSFRVFVLRNKKIGDLDQAQYKNFVKVARRLIKLRSEPKHLRPAKTKKFLSELLRIHPLSSRKWFEEQVGKWES